MQQGIMLLALSFLTFTKLAYGRICASCSGLLENEFCQHMVKCQDNEVCFKEKYKTSGNDIRYDLGCAFPELCKKDGTGQLFGKRESSHSHLICHACCNNTDVCNANLDCNDHLSVPKERCSDCSGIKDPTTCNSTILCDVEEVCFLHSYLTETKQRLYDLGCKHSTLCLHGYKTVFGRRSTSGRHLVCENCCSGSPLCNQNLQCGHPEQSPANSSCTTTNECQNNLMCISGRCQCQDTLYYLEGNKCFERKYVYSKCSASHECKATLNCIRSICQCPSDQYFNGSICIQKRTINATCQYTEQCNDILQCISGKCSCPVIAHTYVQWIDGKCASAAPRECEDLFATRNGVYTIYPESLDKPVLVYCIIDQSKKWTVIQTRVNGSVDFNRSWKDYKQGFGSPYGEYWLGNDNIHFISTNGRHELSIYMEIASGEHHVANYSTFRVGDENSKYVLTVTGWKGTKGLTFDSLRYHDGQRFSTKDQDNDNSRNGSCAVEQQGGWWYNYCSNADLNKIYTPGMFWTFWSASIKKSIMMIRRA